MRFCVQYAAIYCAVFTSRCLGLSRHRDFDPALGFEDEGNARMCGQPAFQSRGHQMALRQILIVLWPSSPRCSLSSSLENRFFFMTSNNRTKNDSCIVSQVFNACPTHRALPCSRNGAEQHCGDFVCQVCDRVIAGCPCKVNLSNSD